MSFEHCDECGKLFESNEMYKFGQPKVCYECSPKTTASSCIIEQGTSCKQFTFNEYELQQHDAEVRNKVIAELEKEKQTEVVKVKDYVEKSNSLKIAMDLIEKGLQIEQLKSELEELKKNAIVPKFKKGQECFYIRNGEIKKCYFEDIIIEAKIIENPRHCFDEDGEEYDDFEEDIIDYNRLFATCEKAEEALKKLEKK